VNMPVFDLSPSRVSPEGDDTHPVVATQNKRVNSPF
jgi:hypothetical protein